MESYYQKIKTIFSEQSCNLHSTEEEICNQVKHGVLFKNIKCLYFAQCNHLNEVIINNFLYRNSGKKCKDCTYKEISRKIKENSFKNNTSFQEQDAIRHIDKTINIVFDVKYGCEGCKIDFAIKPKNVFEDNWLPIQLKTTQKLSFGQYQFTIPRSYENNTLMIFNCTSENRFWICFYDEIKGHPKRFNFRQSEKCKFNRFEVHPNELINYLTHVYFLTKEYVAGNCSEIPRSKTQIQEINYSNIRKKAFENTCVFIDPLHLQSCYDFLANNFKVQEKVASKETKKPGYVICLGYTKSRTLNNNKRSAPYKQGMCDFYYIHIPETSTFYLFPENILIEKGFIHTDRQNGRCGLYISPDYSVGWYNDPKYKHNYNTSDLKSLFNRPITN